MFRKWQFALTFTFVLLGILLSFQFRTQQALLNDLSSQSTETLTAMAKNLNQKHYQLIREVWDLRTQQKRLESSVSEEKTLAETMQIEIDKLNIANGLSPVEGPGIILIIPENNSDAFFYQNMIDIINELWNAGAEAVAVNGIRVTNHTSILPADEFSGILVNGTKITYPYEVSAIGEPSTLNNGISIPQGIVENLRNFYKIPLEIKQVERMELPAAKPINFKYAKPVKE
ncbi:hypothetical protein Tfer_2794 [Thermincola ferriacetica]|uniref:Division initiation protein n=1 Tax=Thermincola ferriacetica TaxID=281456 RepID=A0A0L6VZC1_9FIRM|nr:DUF881 domain-containing protein [Thermincola ferriacetica]KNZ68620.1 hypothetical protein Tfer_2794 [Thermincola ferriacetica]